MQKYENKGDNLCINCRRFNRIFNWKNSDSTDGTVMVSLRIIINIYYLQFYFIKYLGSYKFGNLQQPPLFVDIPISSATNQSTEHVPFSRSVSVECIRQI